MNNYIHANNGFFTNDFYCGDTESLYIESKLWHKLDKVSLVSKNLLQGENV